MTNFERLVKDLTPEDVAHYLSEYSSCRRCPAYDLCHNDDDPKVTSYSCYKAILAWCNMEENK